MKQPMRFLALTALGLGGVLGAVAATEQVGPGRAAVADRPATGAAAPQKPAPTPEAAWQRLKAGNTRFAEEKLERPDLGAGRRQQLARGQKPFAVVLTCADSRLAPEFIFNQGLGDLFVLRVAGNISDPFELGSIEYAVEHLHVPLIVILGHEQCGAVAAALGKTRPAGNLGKLIDEIAVGKDLPPGREAALTAAIKNNVRHQTHLLTERSDVIKAHVARKDVRIVSGYYQLTTGKVEWLDER